MRRKGRECALQALYQLDIQGGLGAEDSAENDLQGSMQAFWGSFESVSLDVQRFAERLVVGVHEHINELDTLLNNVADNWCVDRMSHIAAGGEIHVEAAHLEKGSARHHVTSLRGSNASRTASKTKINKLSITAMTTKPVKPSQGACRLALPCCSNSPSEAEPGGSP